MEVIEKLSDYIDDEIKDAEKYAKFALEVTSEYPSLADAVSKLSEEEMKHMKILHDNVVAIIADYKKKNGDVTADMKTIYDILHRKHIAHAAEAMAYQSMYKG